MECCLNNHHLGVENSAMQLTSETMESKRLLLLAVPHAEACELAHFVNRGKCTLLNCDYHKQR